MLIWIPHENGITGVRDWSLINILKIRLNILVSNPQEFKNTWEALHSTFPFCVKYIVCNPIWMCVWLQSWSNFKILFFTLTLHKVLRMEKQKEKKIPDHMYQYSDIRKRLKKQKEILINYKNKDIYTNKTQISAAYCVFKNIFWTYIEKV